MRALLPSVPLFGKIGPGAPALGLFLALSLLAGCAGSKRAPALSPPLTNAARHAETAAKLASQRNWAGAASEWQMAVEQYGMFDRTIETAAALHNLAQAEMNLGKLPTAREHVEKAAELNQASGQEDAWWHNQLLLLQIAMKGSGEGVSDRFARLIPRSRTIRDPYTRGLFFNEAGLWQAGHAQFGEARSNYKLAEDNFRKAGSARGLAVVGANQAMLAEAEGNAAEAQEHWTRARAVFVELGDTDGLARANAGLGKQLLSSQTDLRRAEDLLLQASTGYRLIGSREEELAVLKMALQAARALEDAAAIERATKRLAELGGE